MIDITQEEIMKEWGGVNCDIKTIKAGDIVYIKKCNVCSDISVRAIGIVTDYEIKKVAKVAENASSFQFCL